MRNIEKYLQLIVLLSLLICCRSVVLGQTKAVKGKIEKKQPSSQQKVKKAHHSDNSYLREAILLNLINNMIFVEGGSFVMGATPEQGDDVNRDEKPAHRVVVSSFSIGKYEVTQEEWLAVMGSNPSYFKGKKRPVEQVTWNECMKFIEKLNMITGMNFRLPTEVEWEYAARGGNLSKRNKFAGGNNLYDVAWFNENSNTGTHDVGKKQANELGLYDMSGNVWEWCSDRKIEYSSSLAQMYNNSEDHSSRVNRGGSWRSSEGQCRVSFRFDDDADDSFNTLGLRLAL